MKLVFFGDEYINNENLIPTFVSNKLNLEFENLSTNDASNTCIHNTIAKKILSLTAPDDYIFLIGWTSPFRLDAEYDGTYFTYKPGSKDYPNSMMNKLHKFDDYLFNKILVGQRWASIVYGVQQLLESQGIKYYMFNIHNPLDYNNYTKDMLDNINRKYYFDGAAESSTMINYLKSRGHNFNSHNDISQSGLMDYADFISQRLKDTRLIS